MSITLTVLLITLCLFSYAYNKYNILLFLLVLSLFGDIFDFQIGVALKLHHFIVLLSLPKLVVYSFHSVLLKNYLKYLILEFLLVIVMGVIFVFIVPFYDPYASSRLFTQTPVMRALISSVRMVLEIFTIILVVNWVLTNKINLNLLIKTISIVLILNCSVAIIDFFIGNQIRTMIYSGVQVGGGRFFGLSGEPRAFGRYNAFGLVFLLYYTNSRCRKLRIYGITASIVGLILSLSASSFIIAGMGIVFYILSKRRIKSTIILGFILISSIVILNTNVFFQNTTMAKINKVLVSNENADFVEKVSSDEPLLFARFEVFDRAALNFFYHHPQYLIFGMGPNLISTPASAYLTATAASAFTEGINTVPASFFVNTLSRSGLVGLLLMGSFFLSVLRKTKIDNHRYFFAAFLLMSLMVATSLIFFFTGLTIALVLHNRRNNITNVSHIKKVLKTLCFR